VARVPLSDARVDVQRASEDSSIFPASTPPCATPWRYGWPTMSISRRAEARPHAPKLVRCPLWPPIGPLVRLRRERARDFSSRLKNDTESRIWSRGCSCASRISIDSATPVSRFVRAWAPRNRASTRRPVHRTITPSAARSTFMRRDSCTWIRSGTAPGLLQSGFIHILQGTDHRLFLLRLVRAFRKWWSLVAYRDRVPRRPSITLIATALARASALVRPS